MIDPFKIGLDMATPRTGSWLLINKNSLGLNPSNEEKHQSFPFYPLKIGFNALILPFLLKGLRRNSQLSSVHGQAILLKYQNFADL